MQNGSGINVNKVNADKNLFTLAGLPIVTIYDDNLFIRNDYDILSPGQRQYLIAFFAKMGFVQKSGKVLDNGSLQLIFPKPNRVLALSAYQPEYIEKSSQAAFFVTPTTFAECLFYVMLAQQGDHSIDNLMLLIDKCPCNLELLRDINIYAPIAPLVRKYYNELCEYQTQVIEQKYKHKKAL